MDIDQQQDLSVPGSWIPVTPGKPIVEKSPPICSKTEANQLKSTLLRQEQYLFGSSQEEQASRPDACLGAVNCVGANDVESREPTLPRNLDHFRTDGGNNLTEQHDKINFSDPLKLATASLLPLASNAADSSSTHANNLGFNGLGIELKHTDLLQNNNWKSIPEGTLSDATSVKMVPQFAPMTPDKATNVDGKQVFQIQSLRIDCMRNDDKMKQDHTLASAADDKSPKENEEPSQPEKDSSLAPVSTPVEQNHNPDKGLSNADNLIEVSAQKQRRRKHRPKVIKEGKPKRTPKPVTPNPLDSNVNPSGKRKYVRKNGISKPSSSSPTKVTEESNEEQPNSTKKSCRRKLDFDQERQPGDESSQSTPFSLDSKSRTQDSLAEKILLRSNMQFGNEIQETVETTQTHISCDLKHCANQMLLTEYKHYVRRPQTTKQVNTISTNLTGTDQNVWAANQMLHCVQFPNIRKKKRTKNGERQEAKFSQSCPENLNASEEHNRVVVPASNISFTAIIGTEKGISDGVQKFVGIMPSFMTEGMTKKRTKGTKRGRSSTSLTKLVNSNFQSTRTPRKIPEDDNKQKVEDSRGQQSCIDTLAKPAILTRKKQTRKMKSQNASYSRANIPQQDLDTAIYKDRTFFYKTLGDYSSHLWDHMLETVTELFDLLYINKKCRKLSHEKHHALVPYDMQNQNQNHNALVIYKRDGTIVPVKKRRPRPKVELDEETDKVWKLLMIDINSTGINGTDEEKAKWWEEERSVFQGRADSFIARMRLVQGDRRFSKWKGSVVDSVVGVFLTQNVSDHLSSSAFMSLAAHFPNGSQSNYKECHQEETNILVDDQEAYLLNQEDTMIQNKQFVCPSFREPIIEEHDSEGNEEIVSSNESLGSNYQSVVSQNESTFKPLSGSESVLQICDSSVPRKTMTGPVTEKPHCPVEERVIYDLISSSISLVSSLDSEISSISRTDDIDVVCLGRNSIQDLPHWPLDNDSISSVKQVQMPEANMLQAMHNQVNVSFSSYNRSDDAQDLLKRMDDGNQSDITQGIHKSHVRSSSSHQLQGEPGKEALANDIFESQREETLVFAVSKNRGNGIEQRISTTESASVLTYKTGLESDNIWKEQNMSPGMLMKTFQNLESPDALSNNKMREGPSDYPKETSYVAEEKTELISQNQFLSLSVVTKIDDGSLKIKKKEVKKQHKVEIDWDRLRKQTEVNGRVRERTTGTMDSLDWEAVRCAEVKEIADTIKERGMNNVLAGRIKDFLNRIVKDHGSIDLEWLRDVSPDQAKEYLLSIRGLGLKSVECVRLLTLHHLAFPVDTNVGRIAVRLGWVPLQPLPESLQLHLLELYPVLETIQKYLWPRLCKLDQKTLYELHYQMITFGKVFCTKNKPNCNSCPMRGECRHFASAFASARLALPAPEEKSMVCASSCRQHEATPAAITNQLYLSLPHATQILEDEEPPVSSHRFNDTANNCEPIIEEPTTPEPEREQVLENDIEDASYEDPDEIPTIKLNIEAFTRNLQNYMQENMELQESDLSRALIALTPEVAHIPAPKLKNISRLRTEHQVYELPDSHPLLKRLKMERREPDDPSLYLLAIWTPGETADSTQPPASRCSFVESGNLCWEKECFSCNSVREANSQTVRGTLLIPCRTAMRGSFPLNGTYFQVNEVFADHDSSLNPIDVPRAWIWNLARRTVYFGTSIPTIFKGLSTEGIQHCFWRGYVCVRGFDQKTRAPRPLMARLHFPASKLTAAKGKNDNQWKNTTS